MNFNHHTSSSKSINHQPQSLGNKHQRIAAVTAFQTQSQLQQQQQLSQQFPQQLSPQFQQQQLPLKTYLLNKYGQYQNTPIEQDDSGVGVLHSVIGGNQALFNSLSSQLNNESSFHAAGSSGLLKQHQQTNYISKFQPQSSVLLGGQQTLQSSSNAPGQAANASLSSQLINLLELNSANTQSTAKSQKSNAKSAGSAKSATKRAPAKSTDTPKEPVELVTKAKANNDTNSLLLGASSVLATNLDAMSSTVKRKYSGSNSSLQNSDDDDDLDESFSNAGGGNGKSKEEKRRLSHTAAEQKRRNAIKLGYELLQNVVPSCQQTDPILSVRITRATTLEQTIDYIYELERDREKHEDEIESLKKEVMALRIMKTNYEEMLQYHRNMPKDENAEVNDETKFELFVKFADNLFHSFQSMLNTNSFTEMSSSILNWIEHSCSSNNLRNLVFLSLVQIGQQLLQ